MCSITVYVSVHLVCVLNAPPGYSRPEWLASCECRSTVCCPAVNSLEPRWQPAGLALLSTLQMCHNYKSLTSEPPLQFYSCSRTHLFRGSASPGMAECLSACFNAGLHSLAVVWSGEPFTWEILSPLICAEERSAFTSVFMSRYKGPKEEQLLSVRTSGG